MVWYCHLFQNFPQFIVIHTVKGFGIVNQAEIDVFLELSCFFDDPADGGNFISGSVGPRNKPMHLWSNDARIYNGERLLSWTATGKRMKIEHLLTPYTKNPLKIG